MSYFSAVLSVDCSNEVSPSLFGKDVSDSAVVLSMQGWWCLFVYRNITEM